MRASVTEARVTVYVCMHMPGECVCENAKIFDLWKSFHSFDKVHLRMKLVTGSTSKM